MIATMYERSRATAVILKTALIWGYVHSERVRELIIGTILTATTEARYRRPNMIPTMTVKITALTGVPVTDQTFEHNLRSGKAFWKKRDKQGSLVHYFLLSQID